MNSMNRDHETEYVYILMFMCIYLHPWLVVYVAVQMSLSCLSTLQNII